MGTNQKRKSRFYKQLFILLLIIAGIGAGLWQYIRWYDASSKVCAKFVVTEASASRETPRLCFEVATNEAERAKGLMFRKPNEIPEHEGMLFVYPGEGMRAFWMKDTFTALDMIFMDSSLKVVGIVENAAPLTQTPRRIDKPSQFILELHAGSSKKWGVVPGAVLKTEKSIPSGVE